MGMERGVSFWGAGHYAKNLNKFFRSQKLDSITPKMVTRYKVQRRDSGASSSTINRELYMLSKTFKLAVNEWEWLNQNPVSKVSKETEDNERDRWLSYKEEEKLIRNCPEWLSDIIIFDLYTGLRQDELLSLEWDRVDLQKKTILIQKTKNGKPKTIPLNQNAFDVLVKRSKIGNIKNDLVFFSIRGTKFNRFNVKRAFSRA
jgi:integrase